MTWGSIRSFSFRRANWRDEISAYLDDELSPRDRVRLEERLAESEEMQEYLADLEQMRSALRRLDTAPSATPFQLTPGMLDDPARIRAQPAGTARALRLSMSTAAVGVATFAAVMVFDAVDSPTVNFTTTSADVQATRVPSAAVVTDEVEVEAQAQAERGEAASGSSGEAENVVAPAQEGQEEEEETAVAAVSSEQEAEQEEAAAMEEEQAEQQAEAYQEEQAQEQAEETGVEESAADPSRRALTAGQRGGGGEAQSVKVEDVVAQQEQAEEAAETEEVAQVSEDEAQEQAADVMSDQGSEEASSAAGTPTASSEDDGQPAAAETETRTVATSVARGESDWPLEQRPRSSTVRLARDPSWELPVQIVLAAVAISSAVFWLVLTIVDRRRRA